MAALLVWGLLLVSVSYVVIKGQEVTSETNDNDQIDLQLRLLHEILNKNDVWRRMETWDRPDTPQVMPQHSLKEDLKTLPPAKEGLNLNEVFAVFYKDEEKESEIMAVEFNSTVDLKLFYVGLYHQRAHIDVYENDCGLGVCFLHKQTGSHHRLILVQQTAFINRRQLRLVKFEMHPSSSDAIVIELNPPSRELNSKRVYSAATPTFAITYDQNKAVVLSSSEAFSPVNIVNHVTTIGGNVRDTSMTAYFETGSDDYPRIQTRKMQASENEANYTAILGPRAHNGVLMTSLILNSRGDSTSLSIFLNVKRVYLIHPSYLLYPAPIQAMTMTYGGDMYNVTAGEVLEIGASVFNPSVAEVQWYKFTVQGWLPVIGFNIFITPLTFITSTYIQSYSITQQDAGQYMLIATSDQISPGFTKNISFSINVFEEHLEVIMSKRKVGNNIVVDCKSKGRPRPSLDFFYNGHPGQIVPVTNSDYMEVGEINTTGELTSRQLTITSFPGRNPRGYNMIDLKCQANNGYETATGRIYVTEYEIINIP